jgi:hypothetical protein
MTGNWPQTLDPDDEAIASWTVTCDEDGFSVIVVDADGTNTNTAVDSVTIKQLAPPEPELAVAVSAPAAVQEGDSYYVTAVVSNIGEATATGVSATLLISGPADTEDTNPASVGTLAAGSSGVVEWEVDCTGEGGVNIAVTAVGSGTNTAADSVGVEQVNVPPGMPYISVVLSAPAEVLEGETYHVTAVVSNIGDATANSVSATLGIAGPATNEDSATKSVGTLAAGSSGVLEWEVECDGEGGVNISVTAAGSGTNTAADSVGVQQVNVPAGSPALTVEVSAPAEIYVGENYAVTAVVTNVGDATANSVNASLVISGLSSTDESLTKSVGALAAGNSGVVEWELTCTGEGGVNIAVTAAGSGTNTAADSVGVQQKRPVPSVTVSIPDVGASPGGTVDVDINVDSVVELGAADVVLSYNPSVVEVSSISGTGDLGTVVGSYNNSTGEARIATYSATGESGDLVLATLTLLAVGSQGQTSDLDLTVEALVDIDSEPILHAVDDGVFTVMGLMEGDANMDGHVTVSDALLVAQKVAGLVTFNADQLATGDTTDEGSVTISDAMHIAQWLVDPDGSLGVLHKDLWESPADDLLLPPVP